MSGDADDEPGQQPAARGTARHRRTGPAYSAEVNMDLMRRLVEGAAASGDGPAAAEAALVCMEEANALYQLAVSERAKAQALTRQAADDLARAKVLHDEAAKAREEIRARRDRVAPGRPAKDAPGSRLRPDPSDIRTAAELIEALRQFRTWAGNPSYRDMARACNGRPAASTMCRVLGGSEVPARFEVIDAIITACGGEEEDRERFATAWRRLILPAQGTWPRSGQLRAFPGAFPGSRRPALSASAGPGNGTS